MILACSCFILFLFLFYALAKDDFVFLRKNVTLEQLLNTIFLGLPFVLISARILYVLLHPKWTYLNPLVFFVIPYFPGLSAGGGIIGAGIFLYFFTRNKKFPSLRFADELGIAFLGSSVLYFLTLAVIEAVAHQLQGIPSFIIGFLYLAGCLLLRRVFIKESWLDGSVAAFAIILKSLFSLLHATILILLEKKFSIHPDDIFSLVILLIGFGFFLFFQGFFRKKQ